MRVNAMEIHPARRTEEQIRDGLAIQLEHAYFADDDYRLTLTYDEAFELIAQLAAAIRRGQVLDRRVAAQAVTGRRP